MRRGRGEEYIEKVSEERRGVWSGLICARLAGREGERAPLQNYATHVPARSRCVGASTSVSRARGRLSVSCLLSSKPHVHISYCLVGFLMRASVCVCVCVLT